MLCHSKLQFILFAELPEATIGMITTNSFQISWVNGPPTFNDGRVVTHYRVTVTPADGTPTQTFDVPAAAGTSHVFNGLSTGIVHNVRIDALVSTNGAAAQVVDVNTQIDVTTRRCNLRFYYYHM